MDEQEIQAHIQAGPAAAEPASRRGGAGMNLRERWRRTMFFQRVDRIPNFEFGYWDDTLSEWHRQGLPGDIVDETDAYEFFGIENWQVAWVDVMGLHPAFERKVIEDTEDYLIQRDTNGCTAQINKKGHKSIPHFIDFHLKDRTTWEDYKARLQPSPDRVPTNWPALAAAYNRRDYPLAINIGSMIGVPRSWMGFERVALMVYDDPALLEEIVETLCTLVCDTLSRVLPDVEFDFGAGWEDICFNSGPIVGRSLMRDIVMPRYQRITRLLQKHGCHIAWTDCDGNIMPILDVFMDGGLNCQFPVEVHAGSDPLLIRQAYPESRLQGGVCKMRLAEGKSAIDSEMKRLLPLVKEGGFIPGVDHRVPANVPLENYLHYLKVKRDLFGVGGVPQYNEAASRPLAHLRRQRSPCVSSWQVSEVLPKAAGVAQTRYIGLKTGMNWTSFSSSRPFVDLHTDKFGDRDGLVYLGNRFSTAKAAEWDLLLGHDGGAKIFVDGKCVLTEAGRVNPARTGRSRVRVKLDRGEHEVVIAFDLCAGQGWGIFLNWEVPAERRQSGEVAAFPERLEVDPAGQ